MLRQQLPLVIIFVSGFFIIFAFFTPLKSVGMSEQTLRNWNIGIAGFFIFIGIVNLIKINFQKVFRRSSGWEFSLLLLFCLFFMMGAGFIGGMGAGSLFLKLYFNVMNPLQATMFSLLAFYVASASYRAFRARTWEATLLLLAALLVMIGRVPLGYAIWHGFPQLTEWIMNVPNIAAKRGIAFGIDLGLMSMALRILLGIERSYMGGGK